MWTLSFIIPLYKKDDPNNKANYRPISITPIISRVFERILVKELTFDLKKKFSSFRFSIRISFW